MTFTIKNGINIQKPALCKGFIHNKNTAHMRLLPTFFLSVMSVLTYAQGFRLKPDTGEVSVGGALSIQSLVSPGPGSWIGVGNTALASDSTNGIPTPYLEKSYVTAFGCSSVGSASKRLTTGIFNVIRTVPGGSFIAAGSRSYYGNDQAYICRLNLALDTISTVALYRSLSDHVYDIAVSPDGSFTAGLVSAGHAVVLRFTSTGMLLWAKEIPHSAFGPALMQTIQLLAYGTNIYVFCSESNAGNDDIALHKLDITTGDETLHRTYGSELQEHVESVKWQGSEIVVLMSIGYPATRTGLMRLNTSLNPAMSIIIDGGQQLVGSELLTNTDGYSFIGGQMFDADGTYYSVVWQVWNNGAIGWKKRLNVYGAVTADMLFEGPNIVVPTTGGTQYGIMMNFVSTSSGLVIGGCENYSSPTISGSLYSIAYPPPPSNVVLQDAVFLQSRGSTISPYSGVIDPCSIPLPVEGLYFRASPEGQKVLLEWATATEHANDGFTVFRSVLGGAFQEVAWVDGAGDSQQQTDYRVYDEHPLPGISYYRLRQTDLDGAESYSDIVAVEFKPMQLLMPYPNPAAAGDPISVGGVVTAYDGLGRVVTTGKDLIVLPVGTYLLRGEDGQKATVVVQ